MRLWLKRVLALVFGVIFCLLMSVFLAHAEAPEIIIDPVDKFYPTELLAGFDGFKIASRKPAPWYVQYPEFKDRVFFTAGMKESVAKWDELDKNIFLDRAGRLTLGEMVEKYPRLTQAQMKAAAKEVKSVQTLLSDRDPASQIEGAR